jgi:carbohydrate-binding DOMON domain-containing protein
VILELLTLASLLRLDPAGDAYGAGDLVPPSAELYADPSSFDLLEVEAGGERELIVRVRLAGIPDPGGLPNGVTLPVIDVYLDLAEGGEELALPGVGMAFPVDRGWEVALRIHGDRAFAVLADDPTRRERPVTVARDGEELTIATGLPAPEEVRDLQAVSGVYDPFSRDGWRPLADAASPWAFASEVPAPPVVDLLAESDELQREALRSYLLPPSRNERGPVGWLLAMFAGLGLAAAGLWLRRRVPPAGAAAETTGPSPDAAPEPAPEPAPVEPIDASELETADAEADARRDVAEIASAAAAAAAALEASEGGADGARDADDPDASDDAGSDDAEPAEPAMGDDAPRPPRP